MPNASTENTLRDTRDWYDEHAREFCKQTAHLPMDHAYKAFLPLIPHGGRILDAGCGSGRDSLRFLAEGYDVTAFDASPEMARLATKNTGLPVRVLGFGDMDYQAEFHGIFANASLLHVPPQALAAALERIAAALKGGGVLFASLKYGQGNYIRDAALRVWRHDEDSVAAMLSRAPGLQPLRTWTTRDTRPERAEERWLHVLARRTSTPISSSL